MFTIRTRDAPRLPTSVGLAQARPNYRYNYLDETNKYLVLGFKGIFYGGAKK